jgi:hypothetical protein
VWAVVLSVFLNPEARYLPFTIIELIELSEVTQTGGGNGVYFGPTQMGPLYDSKKSNQNELCERNRKRIYCCPIHGANPGWNLGTLIEVNTPNVDGDLRVQCPICGTQGLLKAGTY